MQLVLSFSLFAYDFYAMRDTNLYDGSTFIKLTNISAGTEIKIDKIGTGWIYKNEKHDETEPAIEISYNYFNGYIPMKDITVKKNTLVQRELNYTTWMPAYELDTLYSKNPKKLEDYVAFYKRYNEWRKYTDWDEDDWYSSHSIPRFTFINSILRIEGINVFNGYIASIVTHTDGNAITINCVESVNDKFSRTIPDYFTDVFLAGKSYDLKYTIDGDYLYLNINDRKKIVLVGVKPDYGDALFKFYAHTITEEDYEKIIWPRHADGSCDYTDSPAGNRNRTVKRADD